MRTNTKMIQIQSSDKSFKVRQGRIRSPFYEDRKNGGAKQILF